MIRRSQIVGLLKLGLVVALMVIVFRSVQMDDAWTEVRGEQETVVLGRIVGDWNKPEVRFLPDREGAAEITLRPGVHAEGTTHVSPGFLWALRNLDPFLFGLGAIAFFLSIVTAAARWWWLLRINELHVSFWQAQRFTWIGNFFNNFVPGGTGGDLIKALYIMKHAPGARLRALVSVGVDRVMGLASLALLGAIVVLFALDRFAELAVLIWAVLLCVVLVGVLAFSRRVRRMVHLDDLLNRLPGRISAVLKRVDSAIYFYRAHGFGMAVWVILGMLNHVISVTSVVLMGKALSIPLPTLEYFVLIPIVNIISAFPIAPNGWGVGEFMFKHLFSTYGAVYAPNSSNPGELMGTMGVALSVLFRVHITLWSLLGGLFVLLEKDRVTQRDIERETELEEMENRG